MKSDLSALPPLCDWSDILIISSLTVELSDQKKNNFFWEIYMYNNILRVNINDCEGYISYNFI